MNWANRLTLARFFLTLIFVFALSCVFRFHYTIALVAFLLAGATDYADGEIARRFSLVTDFGKLMDPLMDKIMIAAAFICLIPTIPAWVAVIVISREFLITGLRLLALAKGRLLSAEALGKHKTGWQIATVIFFLGLFALSEITGIRKTEQFPPAWVGLAGMLMLTVAVALTLISGVGYFWKNRAVIETQ